MLLVFNPSLVPWFNLASEEYLLKNFDEEVIMLWRSEPSVIVGKHQNTLAEINLRYVMRNNIPVIRRLSGGGTVFHDPGNINFTFIKKVDKENMVNFREHLEPVISFLQSLGVDARFEGKNDLRVNGLKISGNAEHVFRNKVLHHGTLLFDADLMKLNEAIKGREQNFQSKAIRSVKSKVVNIADVLPVKMNREEFMEKLHSYFLESSPWISPYFFTNEDKTNITKLVAEKYSTWDWNFGYSPSYTFENSATIQNRSLSVKLHVAKGIMEEIEILFNGETEKGKGSARLLQGMAHRPEVIWDQILKDETFSGLQSEDKWDILGLFF